MKTTPESATPRRLSAPELLNKATETDHDVLSVRTGIMGEGMHQTRTCLNPRHPLRTQLFLAFGLVSASAIGVVMLTAVATTIACGKRVKARAESALEAQTKENLRSSSRYVAETISKRFEILEGSTSIMAEVVRDRMVGYPNAPGYEDDSNVPFYDSASGRNYYPLNTSFLLPLDWQVKANVNIENQWEHIQNRSRWYGENQRLTTATGIYRMQGQCDPSVTDSTAWAYYPNCTDANNDVRTGGVVRPSATNFQIYRKVSDLNFVLKSLYEYHQDAVNLGILFANSGAGSGVIYPGREVDGTTPPYTSIGCEWMANDNPNNRSMQLASREAINRCRPEGTLVPAREYNPMERGWCRDQGLNPERSHVTGPYLDAWSEHSWLLTFGRAVYDRVTNEFIACTLIDVTIDRLKEILEKVDIGVPAEIALVTWDDGTVVASTVWDYTSENETATVSEVGFGMGVDESVFEEMKSKVNFTAKWDHHDAFEAYERSSYSRSGRFVSTYPVPVPPEIYDEFYYPKYMVIISMDEQDVYKDIEDMYLLINDSVMSSIAYTLIIGFIGLAAIIVFIFAVSNHLTKPLHWMEQTGKIIVDNFGYGLEHKLNLRGPVNRRCSPKTEISALVTEFQKMVSEFSGKGSAIVVKEKVTEMENPFILTAEFQHLYRSRLEDGFKSAFASSASESNPSGGSGEIAVVNGSFLLPKRCNLGPNIRVDQGADNWQSSQCNADSGKRRVLSSPLFWWVVWSIVTPLMVTMILISVLAILEITREIPQWLPHIRAASHSQTLKTIQGSVVARADFIAEVISPPIRHLHLYTRLAGWLLFGGVERSQSFTEYTTGTEECKVHPTDSVCDYVRTAPCDCSWKDVFGEQCQNYGNNDTRSLQKLTFAGQAQDVWPNGDRNFTSFPSIAFSPNTTSWWYDVETIPGSEKGESASGHETTYDRLRVISALSAISMPLYNFDGSGASNKGLGTYIGFEADGMLVAYAGCDNSIAEFSRWQSTSRNGAATLAPSLCPLNKYGYDCRCRDWYVKAREHAHNAEPLLHVTPPYVIATFPPKTAQSCAFPLVEPQTEEVVGVTLIDFIPSSITTALSPEHTFVGPGKHGFPILITAVKNTFGADTIIGPGHSFGDEAVPIADLVLPNDCSGREQECSVGKSFEAIAQKMRDGKMGTSIFKRSRDDGAKETMFIAYAPVTAVSFRPANHSDFQQGVYRTEFPVFSFALVVPESDITLFFEEIEHELHEIVAVSTAAFMALIVLSFASVVFISGRVTISVTVPVKQLLSLVKNINRHDFEDEVPLLNGGSRDVIRVYHTFEKLYKVIRVANAAFFSGDLLKAHAILLDALVTFNHLNDKKAIGIANNNLGNTMLTMYETMKRNGNSVICAMEKDEIIANGIAYFDSAIESGEEALDRIESEVGWSDDYLVFMQQLSNRYFNRAMFLLTVRSDHPQPDQAEEQGKRDLKVAKDMDIEVTDQRAQEGLTCDRDAYLDLVLCRLHGLIRLLHMSYSDEWDIAELFDDALSQVSAALKDPMDDSFREIGPTGRMQQLEAALIEYIACTSDDVTEASKIGIRMLVEDEYVLPEAARRSIEALRAYTKGAKLRGDDVSSETENRLKEYADIIRNATGERADTRSVDRSQNSSKKRNFRFRASLDLLSGTTSARKSLSTEAY